MKRLALLASILVVAGLFALRWHRARATTGASTSAQWAQNYGSAIGPTSQYAVNGNHTLFFSASGGLYAVKAEGALPTGGSPATGWAAIPGGGCYCSGVAGGTCCQPLSGGKVDHVTVPVTLSTGSVGPYIFVAHEDGHLYKIDASNGTVAGSADLRRPGCTNDHLKAEPVVQLARFSTAGFNTAYGGHDMVFVGTSMDQAGAGICAGGTTNNQIIGVDAQTMAIGPRFNSGATMSFDEFVAGCAFTYNDGTGQEAMYCGSRVPTVAGMPLQLASQPSLAGLRTHNGTLSGFVKITGYTTPKSAGDIQVRPLIRDDPQTPGAKAVYVMTSPPFDATGGAYSGQAQVKKFAASGGSIGAQLWAYSLACTNCAVVNPAWMDFRAGYKQTVIVVTTDGTLHHVLDSNVCAVGSVCGKEAIGPHGSSLSTDKFVTGPSPDAVNGKLYVGKGDGNLHQLNMDSGSDDGYIKIDDARAPLGDPSLDSNSGTTFDRLSQGGPTGNLKRLCPPFPFGTMNNTLIRTSDENPPSDPGAGSELPPTLSTCPGSPVCTSLQISQGVNCCGCDADCAQYIPPCVSSCVDKWPISPDCNVRKCDVATGACYVQPVNNGRTGCSLAYQPYCTLTGGTICEDGICNAPMNCDCINGAPQGSECTSGQCCARGCTAMNTTTDCGGCGIACGHCPGVGAPGPAEQCIGNNCCCTCGSGACVDLGTNAANCGFCGTNCTTLAGGVNETCVNSQCCHSCGSPQAGCYNVLNDIKHCGNCNTACGENEQCSNGVCSATSNRYVITTYFVGAGGVPFVNACNISGAQHFFLAGTDDAVTPAITVPFTFTMFGQTMQPGSALFVTTNGLVYFATAANGAPFSNVCPGSMPTNSIAPFWDDLKEQVDNTLCVSTTPTQVAVTWRGFQLFNDAGSDLTFTLLIDQQGTGTNGDIEIQYATMSPKSNTTFDAYGNSATVALEGAPGFVPAPFITYSCDQVAIEAGLGIKFHWTP
jgi:hypothetical protein